MIPTNSAMTKYQLLFPAQNGTVKSNGSAYHRTLPCSFLQCLRAETISYPSSTPGSRNIFPYQNTRSTSSPVATRRKNMRNPFFSVSACPINSPKNNAISRNIPPDIPACACRISNRYISINSTKNVFTVRK